MPALSMFRGDTFVYAVQLFANNVSGAFTLQAQGLPPPPGSAAVALTGGKLWFTAKAQYADPDQLAIAALSSPTSGIVFNDAPNGKATVTMGPAATAGIGDTVVVLVYDVQWKDPTGVVSTVEVGTMTVTPDATRSTS